MSLPPAPPALAAAIAAIAAQAAAAILAVYRTDFTVDEKADRSPVTQADLAAHDIIVAALGALTPDIPVLSEESARVPLAERSGWTRLWLVDPLDGTREFVRRNDEFSINIALIEQHVPVFGLIHVPVAGTCYWAARGAGAWKLDTAGATPHRIHSRLLGDAPVRVAGSRVYTGHPLTTYLEHLGRHEYRGVGSALKACLIAEGEADLYPRFGPTCEWDTAASQIILEEAGGGLTDTFMRPLRYNARPILLNPDFIAFGDPSRDWSRYLPRRKSKA